MLVLSLVATATAFAFARAMDASEKVQDFSREPGPALTGRRKKRAKDAQKKLKAGSFGMPVACLVTARLTQRLVLALAALTECLCSETMGFGPMVMKGIRRKGYRLPTPIQRKAMPFILQGQDVVGMARTGSGKTAAFVLPLIDRQVAQLSLATVWHESCQLHPHHCTCGTMRNVMA